MPTRPKPQRLVDDTATLTARERDGACLYGLWHKEGCSGGIDGHHIITVGAGGPDDPRQIITLCRKHHNLAHLGYIEARELRRLMGVYHGYRYDHNGRPMEAECQN